MSNNLYEFIGMVMLVTSMTTFVVGFRWAIYKLDNGESRHHRTVGDKDPIIKKTS